MRAQNSANRISSSAQVKKVSVAAGNERTRCFFEIIHSHLFSVVI